MTDIIGPVPSGELYQLKVRLLNCGSSQTTVTVTITDSTNTELARQVWDWPLDVKHALELDTRLLPGHKLRAQAGAANSLHVTITYAARQF
jgi:hypothetical protein